MKPDRSWLLVSHANPEDNQTAIWFATQLANEGYNVWSDVISLIGGENFWGDIENAIRYRAAKVVYLLSRSSNTKDGCLKELHLAQSVARKENLQDFVIPLRVDDLPNADVNIRLSPINIIDARIWNTGLAQLLRKLDTDRVPRGPAKDFRASSAWWKARFATARSVRTERETLYSNWFRLQKPAPVLHWHRLRRRDVGPLDSPQDFPWPALAESGGIWTFAPAESVSSHLPQHYYIDQTTISDLSVRETTGADPRQAAFRLLTLAWHGLLRRRGLVSYQLANNRHCFYFPKDLIDKDEISFDSPDGRKGYRAVVGYKTRIDAEGKSWLRHWHYAIQPLPAFRPDMLVMIRSHVLFSSDGKTIWDKPKRLQKARRNQCKGWWNDAWRDRALAVMNWLAAGENAISLQVGALEPIFIDRHPILFDSPVSYLESPSDAASDTNDVSGGDHMNEEEQEEDDEDADLDDGQDQEDEKP